MRSLRRLLFPVVAPWVLCAAALGVAVAAFPEDPGAFLPGGGQPGGTLVEVRAGEPGTPPGPSLVVFLRDPAPPAFSPFATTVGTLKASFFDGDTAVPLDVTPVAEDGIITLAAAELTDDGEEPPGLGLDFVPAPTGTIHGSQAWGVAAVTTTAAPGFGATRGVVIHLLWLAGIPLVWSAAWTGWRLRAA